MWSSNGAVDIILRPAKQVYTVGDTIYGDVTLEILDSAFMASRVVADILCVEHLQPKGPQGFVHHSQIKDVFSVSADKEMRVAGLGTHVFSLEVTLSKSIQACPPSFCSSESSVVTWSVIIWLEYIDFDGQRQVCKDLNVQKFIDVYPTVPNNEMLYTSVKANYKEASVRNMRVALLSLPRKLPPAPLSFNVGVAIVPSKPTYVEKVEVTLIQTVKYGWWPLGKGETKPTSQRLSCTWCRRMVSEAYPLKYEIDDAQLNSREPPAFRTFHVDVSYKIQVEVTSADPCVISWRTDVASPLILQSMEASHLETQQDVKETPRYVSLGWISSLLEKACQPVDWVLSRYRQMPIDSDWMFWFDEPLKRNSAVTVGRRVSRNNLALT